MSKADQTKNAIERFIYFSTNHKTKSTYNPSYNHWMLGKGYSRQMKYLSMILFQDQQKDIRKDPWIT